MAEHPEEKVPIRLSDEEMTALGAFIRGEDHGTPETQARAVATVGMKLTAFFMDVARQAVEHYDRESGGSGS